MVDNSTSDSGTPRTVSKLSLLISFIAGAFAAWIIISASSNTYNQPADSPFAVSPIVPTKTKKMVKAPGPAKAPAAVTNAATKPRSE